MTQTEIQPRVSNKLIGRIKTALQQSPMRVLRDGAAHRVSNDDEVKSSIEQIVLPFSDLGQESALNGKLPEVVGILANSHREIPYLEDVIGGYDIANLLPIAQSLTENSIGLRERSGVAIRVIFGATEEMPLRALSYILSALQLMQQLQDRQIISPQLQVIFTNHIGSALNNLTIEATRGQSIELARVARRYVQTFFPDLSEQVVFAEDVPVAEGRLKADIENIATILQAQDSSPLTILREKSQLHDGGIAEYYGAAHALFHDTDAVEYIRPLFVDEPEIENPTAIISMGGKQEELFYFLRFQHMRQILGERVLPTLQYITRHHIPPYYMDRNGDIKLGDTLQGQRGMAANFDLEYLQSATAERGGNLERFLQGGFYEN